MAESGAGTAQAGQVGKGADLVANLASVLPWLARAGLWSAPVLGGILAGVAGVDYVERAGG